MINKLETMKCELKKLVENQKKFEFPDFLRKMREALSLSKQTVANDLDLNYRKLFYMELGYFREPFSEELTKKMSEYFGISDQLLKEKITDFLTNQKR